MHFLRLGMVFMLVKSWCGWGHWNGFCWKQWLWFISAELTLFQVLCWQCINYCDIWGSYSIIAEDSHFLGWDVVWLGRWFQMFQKIVVSSSSGSGSLWRIAVWLFFLGLLNHADGGTTILKKVGSLIQLHSITPQKTWIHIRCCWSCMGVVATYGSGLCCQYFGGACCFHLQGQNIQDMCQILTSIVVPDLWKKGELVLGPGKDCCL